MSGDEGPRLTQIGVVAPSNVAHMVTTPTGRADVDAFVSELPPHARNLLATLESTGDVRGAMIAGWLLGQHNAYRRTYPRAFRDGFMSGGGWDPRWWGLFTPEESKTVCDVCFGGMTLAEAAASARLSSTEGVRRRLQRAAAKCGLADVAALRAAFSTKGTG